MTRVLFLITSSDFGGAETLFYQQARSLDRQHFTTLICSVKTPGAVARALQSQGHEVCSLDLDLRKSWYKPWALFQKARRLYKIIQAFQPDVLHASLFQADILSAVVGSIAEVPVRLATVHMVLRNRLVESVVERLLSPLLTGYIAVSDDIRRFYTRFLFLGEDKVEVVLNAVDEADLRARSTRAVASVDLSLPWVTLVGRLHPQKDIPNLLEALAILAREKRPVGAVIVGEGPQKEALIQRANDLGLMSSVRFLGFQENPAAYIAAGRALVVSSREEGLPMVILEAMALGKPVIATAVGAIPEVLEDGVNGLVVPAQNPTALAQALGRVVEDADLATRLGEKGLEVLRNRFSLAVLGQRLSSLYEKLLAEAHAQ